MIQLIQVNNKMQLKTIFLFQYSLCWKRTYLKNYNIMLNLINNKGIWKQVITWNKENNAVKSTVKAHLTLSKHLLRGSHADSIKNVIP